MKSARSSIQDILDSFDTTKTDKYLAGIFGSIKDFWEAIESTYYDDPTTFVTIPQTMLEHLTNATVALAKSFTTNSAADGIIV